MAPFPGRRLPRDHARFLETVNGVSGNRVQSPPSARLYCSAIHLADALKHSLALAFAQGSARPYKATVLRRLATAWLGDRRQFSRKWLAHTCPICGYFGMFISAGKPPRWDARCPQCGSRERHRLTQLWLGEDGGNKLDGKRILHFAPEKVVVRQMRHNPLYETADLHQVDVTHRVDISQVPLPDASYDVVIAHHVLEHVDNDRQAMSEVFRLLKPGALAVLSVPINAARQQTYENPLATSPEQRFAHFGDEDHRRFYGLDFAERLVRAGFCVATFRVSPEDEVRYGLLRDEWLTIAEKPVSQAAERDRVEPGSIEPAAQQ
jgi:SAM-dependent methyltransferase